MKGRTPLRALFVLLPVVVAACTLRASPPSAGDAQRFQGLYRYFADAASLQDCASGRTYPVLVEGEHLALERAWLAANPRPGERRVVEFDAVVEMRAPEPGMEQRAHLRVVRFVSIADATSCAPGALAAAAPPLALTDTTWRVEQLDGRPLAGLALEMLPTLRFAAAGGSVAGYAGCNRYAGSYVLRGKALRFGELAMTRMACAGEAGVLEQRFTATLREIRGQRLGGTRLELLDESGAVRVVAQASGE
jgi:copper homeostasis protein (lipoprotein)